MYNAPAEKDSGPSPFKTASFCYTRAEVNCLSLLFLILSCSEPSIMFASQSNAVANDEYKKMYTQKDHTGGLKLIRIAA